MRSRIILDIETSGVPFDSLDAEQQQYLLKFTISEEDREEEKRKVNLYPYTASVVAIGMLNVDSEAARVYYLPGEADEEAWTSPDGRTEFIPLDERSMLEFFWRDVRPYEQIITFNGRMFDAPFLHVRSAMLGVPASRSLMPPRYNSTSHFDLMEQLTFFHATRRFSLDFLCTAFGIDSPKRHGVTGHDINAFVAAGRFRDIAVYNERDLRATRELYLRWMHSWPGGDRVAG
ncbi:MAG: ribonuclease H-like domain-containing protein [Bacteroidia bacterium]|nr:ribonuclease H-like domain-containing protein [Bacteroidia bacterium]